MNSGVLENSPSSVTIETKIKSSQAFVVIDALNSHFSSIMRHLYVKRYIRGEPLNDLKGDFLRSYEISARHFNSIRIDLSSRIESHLAALQEKIKSLLTSIKKAQRFIKKLEKEINKLKSLVKRIKTFILAIRKWREKKSQIGDGPSSPRPKLAKEFKGLSLPDLENELKEKLLSLHQKKRYLFNLGKKLDRSKDKLSRKSFCFGGRKLQKAQHHLQENGFDLFQDWQEQWKAKRDSASFWVGSKDESWGNQNAQYNPQTQTLQLRIPGHFEEKFGPYLKIPDIQFRYGQEYFLEALSKGQAVSYRILKRLGRKDTQYYLQAIFDLPSAPVITRRVMGSIGLDFNTDHVAATETDRFGNPLKGESFYFSTRGKSQGQIQSALSDHLTQIVQRSVETQKPLVVEKLDFKEKKAGMRSVQGPIMNEKLSQFAYKKFFDLVKGKAAKMGVEVISVNPAYSSLIGLVKFRGYLQLTSHEMAALSLARRGLHFSERPKQKVTLGSTVSTADLSSKIASFKQGRKTRHVWSFWSFFKKSDPQVIKSAKAGIRKKSMNPHYPKGNVVTLVIKSSPYSR